MRSLRATAFQSAGVFFEVEPEVRRFAGSAMMRLSIVVPARMCGADALLG